MLLYPTFSTDSVSQKGENVLCVLVMVIQFGMVIGVAFSI